MKMPRIAIVGNPNVGKSTLFNRLTGGAQKIGNWPGKTVEIKEGTCKKGKLKAKIIDLPGVYSLSSNSPEEIVANEYIRKKKPDAIINIVDSTNLERNLYLTTQLLELNQNIILALNMDDIAQKKGIKIDAQKISEKLRIKTVKISAKTGQNIDELISTSILQAGVCNKQECGETPVVSPKERYNLISQIAEQTVSKPLSIGKKSEKIDKIVTNKYFSIPIFIVVMWLTFQLTFTLATPFMDFIETAFKIFGEYSLNIVQATPIPSWVGSLIVDGIIGGVGGVLIFLPNILILFFILQILEDLGYFARIAVVMDSLMQRIGLEGKAFIPLILGFGCNVPAIMATRMLEDENERLISILINPLMSCSARLPIYVLFVGVFFRQNQGLVLLLIYLFGAFLAVSMAYLLRRILLKKTKPPHLLIELPPYRIPEFSNIIKNTMQKAMLFIKKAGYIILLLSVFIWFLAFMPFGVEYASEESYIGTIGTVISPVFAPAGFGNWEATVALIFGAMAKEVVVSTLGTLYSAEGESLNAIIAQKFTPLSALSFMLFSLIYMPCIAAMAAIRKETGSTKWMLFAAAYLLILAWVVAVSVFQIGKMLGYG